MLRIPGYNLKREIGVGGMASVYLAVQTSLERQVALKIMAPALAADQSFSKRFLREARTVAGLSHPNIVSIYDVGITQAQVHYFSMQYLPNGDFADLIRQGVREREVIRVLIGIAEALGYAHKRGFVHRDVTPGNIMFDGTNNPVLTDFGIVKAVSDSSRITGTGLSIGTSHYMSPEQARGRAVDARSDIYSMGAVAYEALAGEPPFEGEDGFAIAYSHVFDPIPKLPQRLERWQPFIEKSMAKDPEDRFQSVADMIDEMDGFLEQTTGEGRRRDPPPLLSREGLSEASAVLGLGRVKLAASVIKGAPGSIRYAIWDSASQGLGWCGDRLIGLCHRLFFFMPRERQVLSGLLTVFLLAGLAGMSIDWSDGRLPVSTRASLAATTGEVRDAPESPRPDLAADGPAQGPSERSPPTPTGEALDLRAIRREAENRALTDRDPADLAATGFEDQTTIMAEPGMDEEQVALMAAEARRQSRITDLLDMGRTDLAANRLTTPEDGNAVDRFQQVLDLDPGNEEAREGLQGVVSRYLDLAERELRRSEFPTVALYIERGEAVAESLTLPGSLAARLRATRGLAYEQVQAAAQEAHVARRVDEAIALYEAALIFEPENEQAITAIAALRSGVAANQSFVDQLSDGNEGPPLVVLELSPFRLDTAGGTLVVTNRRKLAVTVGEITVGQFRLFVTASGYYDERRNRRSCRDQESIWRSSRRRTWEDPGFPQGDDHPVVCVTWDAAQAYASWLSSETGLSYRLPSESEWEFLASRGPGSRHQPASLCERGNIGDRWLKSQYPDAVALECEDGWAFTAPARTFLANDLGVHDLLGNVREWVADCWQEERSLEGLEYSAYLGGDCRQRVVKGTAWFHGENVADVSRRLAFDANDAFNTVGFRLVRPLD